MLSNFQGYIMLSSEELAMKNPSFLHSRRRDSSLRSEWQNNMSLKVWQYYLILSFLFLYLCPSSLPLSLFLFYYLYFSLPIHPPLLPQQLGNRAIAEWFPVTASPTVWGFCAVSGPAGSIISELIIVRGVDVSFPIYSAVLSTCHISLTL